MFLIFILVIIIIIIEGLSLCIHISTQKQFRIFLPTNVIFRAVKQHMLFVVIHQHKYR